MMARSFLKRVMLVGFSVFLTGVAMVCSPVLFSTAQAMPVIISFGHDAVQQTESLWLVTKGETVKARADAEKMGQGAEAFVADMAERGLDFLGDQDLSLERKREKFATLLKDSFDMNTIGRFSLGRYWRGLSSVQRDEYMDLFREMVIDIYSSRFSDYKGEKFEVRGHRVDGPKDTMVTSYVMPSSGGAEVQVDWRVRYKDGAYRVIDVVVEGVSMSVTQRSDFSAIIQRGGGSIDVLLQHLKAQQQKSL